VRAGLLSRAPLFFLSSLFLSYLSFPAGATRPTQGGRKGEERERKGGRRGGREREKGGE
jgi:hypothetical protein